MPICSKCGMGYDDPEENCPKCGLVRPDYLADNDRRCGNFAFFCLHYARVAAFIVVIASLVGVLVAIYKNQWLEAAKFLLVGFPLAYGHFTALSIAVKYAGRE